MWRLINSGPGGGAWNMAVDEAIFEACIRGEAPPTLRFYSWQPPAITLGHFQSAESALKLEACRARGLEVARRPTGGRAILHDKEITFSIIAPLAALSSTGVMDSYHRVAQGIIAGLSKLGVAAELVNSRAAAAVSSIHKPRPDRPAPAACFAVKARCDLITHGRKIVGSAQVHRKECVLQQNSLPFVIEAEKWQEFFQGTDNADHEAIGLWEALGKEVPLDKVVEALVAGFEQELKISYVASNLTEKEHARADELACEIKTLL